ncbi:MAG: hypothetical protein K0S76_977 [Herbinix sp.]|jgi:hypothetical protein|nr:hypothetical protein [Herbinix sp.]
MDYIITAKGVIVNCLISVNSVIADYILTLNDVMQITSYL